MRGYLALDVGGSSVKTALVDGEGNFLNKIRRYPSRSTEGADEIIGNLKKIISGLIDEAEKLRIQLCGAGIGFPGPFDYSAGISLMRGLGKFESIYGIELGSALAEIPGAPPIAFANDAEMYTMGECRFGVGKDFSRLLCICIGTGIGSGFYADGRVVKSGVGVPENGWIYSTPVRGETADMTASAAGIRRMMAGRREFDGISDVRELAEAARSGNGAATLLFDEFGRIVAEAVAPHIAAFKPEALVVGGDVAKSFDLFEKSLRDSLDGRNVQVLASEKFSDNTLLAASQLFENRNRRKKDAAL